MIYLEQFLQRVTSKTQLLFTISILSIFLGCSEDENGIGILSYDDFNHHISERTNTKLQFQLESQEDLTANEVAVVIVQLDGSDEIKRIEVGSGSPFLETVIFEDLTPETRYPYTISFEHSNGEQFISTVGGEIETYPTVPIPVITGIASEKHWPGGSATFVGEHLSFEPFAGVEVFLGDVETNGDPDIVFIPDNISAGLFAVSMKFAYHEILTDAIVNVVNQEISSIDKSFGDRVNGGETFTIKGTNFHPEKDKNEVYLDEKRLRVLELTSDGLSVSLTAHPDGLPLESGTFSTLNLKIESYEVQSLLNVTVVPEPWTALNDMPIGIYDGSLFESNGKAYLVGGISGSEFSDKLWEYDPSNDTWIEKSSFPGGGRSGGVALSLGGKGYFGLGQSDAQTYNQDWWEYDPSTDSWKQLKDYEGGGLLYGVGFSIDDVGYVGNGVSSGNMREGFFWKYNATTDAWIRIADYLNGEERASATVLDGKAYVGFGNNGSLLPGNKLYVYDPVLDQWSFITEDPFDTRSDGVLLTIDNSIYFVSGFDSGKSSGALTKYTVGTDSWEQRVSMHATSSGVGFVHNDKLIVIGGDGLGAIPKIVKEYNPENDLD